MAFPAVESTAVTDGSAAATSHAVNLPATVSAGALLIIVGRVSVAGAVAVTGGGWTITQDSSDGSDDVTFWMYRDTLAAGTEDGSTITVTHGSGKLSAVSFSITGAESPATRSPEASTVAVGTGTAPNATTCTPTGGAKDYLWITAHGADGEHTVSGYPYASNNVVSSTGTGGAVTTNTRTAVCTTNVNAASLDAGAFTTSINVNAGWTAWTIAVHPTTAVTSEKTGAMLAGTVGAGDRIRERSGVGALLSAALGAGVPVRDRLRTGDLLASVLQSGVAVGVSVQSLRPDADLATTGWTTTPLWSKLNDDSDASYASATLA